MNKLDQMDLWVQNGTLPNDNLLSVSGNKRVRSVGKNLLDTIESGGLITNDGLEQINTTRIRTNFIKVRPGFTYISSHLSELGFRSAFYYDINKNFVSTYSLGQYYVIPNDVFYIRVVYSKVNPADNITTEFALSNNLQFEEGTTATAYEPYTLIYS